MGWDVCGNTRGATARAGWVVPSLLLWTSTGSRLGLEGWRQAGERRLLGVGCVHGSPGRLSVTGRCCLVAKTCPVRLVPWHTEV